MLGGGLLDAGGEFLGERVAVRGATRVYRLAVLAALGCLGVQVPGDLDHLAVHGDDTAGLVDLPDGQGGQLAPPQPAVGGGAGHQLIPLPVQARGQCPAELADVAAGRDLGGVDPQRRLPRDGHPLGWQRAVPGLPVHHGQPRAGQVPALDARGDQGREHPVHPVAFPGRRRGVDDLLGVRGLAVLAGDRADDRRGEPLAQPPLGVGVLAGPQLPGRQPAGSR
jgi:hypothetical protein